MPALHSDRRKSRRRQGVTADQALGQTIRILRLDRGVSLAELGAALGVGPSTVSRLEGGVIALRVVHVRQIARRLGVSGADLLERAEKLAELFPPP